MHKTVRAPKTWPGYCTLIDLGPTFGACQLRPGTQLAFFGGWRRRAPNLGPKPARIRHYQSKYTIKRDAESQLWPPLGHFGWLGTLMTFCAFVRLATRSHLNGKWHNSRVRSTPPHQMLNRLCKLATNPSLPRLWMIHSNPQSGMSFFRCKEINQLIIYCVYWLLIFQKLHIWKLKLWIIAVWGSDLTLIPRQPHGTRKSHTIINLKAYVMWN